MLKENDSKFAKFQNKTKNVSSELHPFENSKPRGQMGFLDEVAHHEPPEQDMSFPNYFSDAESGKSLCFLQNTSLFSSIV